MVKFKNRLSEIGHFFTSYKSTEDLLLQFSKQLDRLEDKGLIKLQDEIKAETKAAITNYMNINNYSMRIEKQEAEKIINVETNYGGINFNETN
jgi:flagellar motor component MotA